MLRFSSLALLGLRKSPWLIALALIGHGVFDAVAHWISSDPSPEWWGPFCLGVDVVLGVWLSLLIFQKKIRADGA